MSTDRCCRCGGYDHASRDCPWPAPGDPIENNMAKTTSFRETVDVTKLAACPFCGGCARSTISYGDERTGYDLRVAIKCDGCSVHVAASGDSSKGGYADNSTVVERAEAAWNRRPSSQPATATVAWRDDPNGHTRSPYQVPQPAPATGDIDVTKVPGYVTPQQAAETAAAHAAVGVPRDPCDCSACVKMRGGLYGDAPTTGDCLTCGADPAHCTRDECAPATGDAQCERCGEAPKAHADAHWCDNQSFTLPATGDEREALADAIEKMPYPDTRSWSNPEAFEAGFNCAQQGAIAVVQASAAHRREDQRDAERWRWLRKRYTGFDFDWMPSGPDERDGKSVAVFDMGRDFSFSVDITEDIDAAMQRTAAPALAEKLPPRDRDEAGMPMLAAAYPSHGEPGALEQGDAA